MSIALRSVLAVLFVAALAAVLTYPLASGGEKGDGALPAAEQTPRERGGRASPRPTPAASPTAAIPAIDPPGGNEALRRGPLVAPFPRNCLGREGGVEPANLVAVAAGGRVTVATTAGDRRFSVPAGPPVAWSSGGAFLATGEGVLFDRRGKRMGRLFPGVAVSAWAWAPRAQCAFGIGSPDGRLVLGKPHRGTRTLVGSGVEAFALSPDGRSLAYIRREEDPDGPKLGLWVARLDHSRTTELVRFPSSVVAAEIGPWLPSGRHVLVWTAPGASILADGVTLRAADVEGSRRGGASLRGYRVTALAYPDQVEHCGGSAIAVVGGGRDSTREKVLAFVDRPPRADVLTDDGFAYAAPSCSPDAEFVVAVRAPEEASPDTRRLVLLDGRGTLVRELTTGEGLADESPEWGPRGTGVLFVRRPTDGGEAQVWFIAEGSAARDTGLRLEVPRPFYGSYGWRPLLDWSATAPVGLSAGRR